MYVLQTFVRDRILSFSKHKTDIDIDSSRSWRLAEGKPDSKTFMTTKELKKALCGKRYL